MTTAFTPDISFETEIFQNYLQGLKAYWKSDLYKDVAAGAKKHSNKSPADIEVAMRKDDSYRLYGWLERHLQQFKYVSRYGILPEMERQRAELARQLDDAARRAGNRLRLDDSLVLPEYYTESDIHQHPGGIWSDDEDAFAYEYGANAFTFSMVDANRPYRWLAEYLVERFKPTSVVDLGCGFGKLTLPIKAAAPDARVTGVDLSAPTLRLANLRALEAGLDVDFVQADAEKTKLPGQSFDGVTCYWLLHELPPESIQGLFREARRLVKPGGFFASLDLHTAPGGNVGSFLHIGHAARNNEPFMPGLLNIDLRSELRAAGFTDVELVNALTGAPGSENSAPLDEVRTHTFTVVIARVPK